MIVANFACIFTVYWSVLCTPCGCHSDLHCSVGSLVYHQASLQINAKVCTLFFSLSSLQLYVTQAAEGVGHRLTPNAASPMPVRHIDFPTSRHGLPQHSRIAQPFPSAVPTAVTAHAVGDARDPVQLQSGQQQHMHASAIGKLPASAAAASSSRAVMYLNPTAVQQLPQQPPQKLPGSIAKLSHVSWPQPVVGWPQQSTAPHEKGQPSSAVTAFNANDNHFQAQFVQSAAGLPGPVTHVNTDVLTRPAVAQQGAGVGSLASVPQQPEPARQQQQPQQAWQQQPQQQQPEQAWRQQQQQQEGVHTEAQLATGAIPQGWQPRAQAQAAATAQQAEASYKQHYSAVTDGRLGAQAPAATANGDANVRMQTEVVPSNKR